MKKILSLLLCCIFTTLLHAQNYQYKWAKRSGGQYTSVASVLTDASGNIYTTGTYSDTAADFDPGPGVYKLYNNLLSNINGYITKLNPQGGFITAKKFCSGLNNNYYSAARSVIDAAGNIYVTGSFLNPITFFTATGSIVLTSSGNDDAYICKLDPYFNVLWAKKMGGTGYDAGFGLAVGSTGNVYITGYFQGYGNFDPGISNASIWALNDEAFVCKFNSSGNFVWVKGLGGLGNENGKAIAIDSVENVFTTGYFTGTADFDPSTATSFNLTSSQGRDVFISKLDSAGNYKWAGRIGTYNDEIGNTITIDRQGNVITAGWYISAMDVDPGSGTTILPYSPLTSYGYYLLKMDNNCNFIWGKQLGGSTNLQTISLTVDTLNNIYATGCYTDSADFDTGPGYNYLPSSDGVYGNQDDFVARIDPNGQCVWVAGFGNHLGLDMAAAISVDKAANVYTVGHFADTVDFDPGPGVDTLINFPTSMFGTTSGVYIHKLGQCSNTTSSINATACSSYTYNGQIYTTSGTYLIHYTNAGGCDSTVTLNLAINSVNDNVTQSGANLTTVQAGGTYQWVRCPDFSFVSGATNQSYTATVSGSYAVIITSAGGCTDTSNCYAAIAAGVGGQSNDHSLSAYPNPSKGTMHIASGQQLNNASLNLISILGETVLSKDHITGRQTTIDLGGTGTGIYFLIVRDGNDVWKMKLEIVR